VADRSILFRFSASGQADVVRVFDTILERVHKMGVAEEALARSTLKSIIGSARSAEKEKAKLALEGLKASNAASREKLKVETSSAQAEIKLATEKAKQGLRLHEAGEKAKTRATEMEMKRRHDVEMQGLRKSTSEQMNVHRSTMRQQEHDARQFARDRAFEERRLYKGLATGVGDAAFGGLRSTGRMLTAGASAVAGGMGMNKAWDVQDMVSERMLVSTMMSRVAIEARQAGGTTAFDKEAAIKKIAATSKRTGLSQRDLAQAIDVYSEKGSGATAVANIDRIATQAQAMGTSAAVVAKTRAQLGISSAQGGKEMTEDEKDKFMAMMHFAGKTGVFRAEDLAGESENLFSRWAASGQNFNQQGRRFLQFANVVRTGTGSAAEARTAMRSMQDVIGKNKAGVFTKAGVKTRDDKGNQLDVIDVMFDAIEKTGGRTDSAVWNKLFPDIRAQKAAGAFATKFRGAGGGKAGRAAMEEMIKGDASLDKASMVEMQKDFDTIMEDPAMKMAKATEEIRQALTEQLLPVIHKFSELMTQMLPTITRIIKFVGDNPKTALAATFVGGALHSALPGVVGSGLRYAAGKLVNTVPGFLGAAGSGVLGKGAGKLVGAAGGAMLAATSTHVWVDNWPAGGIGGGDAGGGGLEVAKNVVKGVGAKTAMETATKLASRLALVGMVAEIATANPYSENDPRQKGVQEMLAKDYGPGGRFGPPVEADLPKKDTMAADESWKTWLSPDAGGMGPKKVGMFGPKVEEGEDTGVSDEAPKAAPRKSAAVSKLDATVDHTAASMKKMTKSLNDVSRSLDSFASGVSQLKVPVRPSR